MKRLEKFELISIIGRELQVKMTYSDISLFLSEFGVDITKPKSGVNSKWVYVKDLLGTEPDEIILKIADELNINHNYSLNEYTVLDADFWKQNHFKLFISHLSSFRDQTHKLQQALIKYGISSFVAHNDIEPTREWQNEIETALFTMDALAAIIMPGFNESKWTDQEIGFAIGRNKLVIPIRKGLDPYGFIGKYQGFNSNGKTIEQVAEGIFEILISNRLTKKIMLDTISSLIISSSNMESIHFYIKIISKNESIALDILEKLKNKYNDITLIADPIIKTSIDSLFTRYSITIPVNDEFTELKEEDIPF